MTIYQSDAAASGLMPDYSRAGVVLCRSGRYTAPEDGTAGADMCQNTIQMVPIPKYAQILQIEVVSNNEIGGATDVDIGDSDNPDRFFDGISLGTARNISLDVSGIATQKLYTYTENNTIDIAFNDKAQDQLPSTKWIQMNVWYKMAGSISDEDFD